jgi:hypothetical protein
MNDYKEGMYRGIMVNQTKEAARWNPLTDLKPLSRKHSFVKPYPDHRPGAMESRSLTVQVVVLHCYARACTFVGRNEASS